MAAKPGVLVQCLNRLLAEKEVKKSSHAKLKQTCEHALAILEGKAESTKPPTQAAVPPTTETPPAAEKKEGEEAKETQPPAAPTDGGDGATNEKQTQAQHTATAPASTATYVDEDVYLHPFRLACDSKSEKVKRTAIDCLQKLMAYGVITRDQVTNVANVQGHTRLVDVVVEIICRCFVGEITDDGVQLQIIKALLTAVTSSTCGVHEGTLMKAIKTCHNIYIASKDLVNQTTAKATLTQMLSVVFQRLESTTPTVTATVTAPSTPNKETEKDVQQPSETDESEVEGNGKGKATEEEGAAVDTEEKSDSADKESALSSAANSEEGNKSEPAQPMNLYRKDALQVFRSMCKLSMKELPNKDVIDMKSNELRSKILSLELQLAIVQTASTVFATDPLFIEVVIKHLCVALSKNGVSHVPAVFELSLGIFLVLLSKFKVHLKMQIEVFFKEILLSMLEISTSSFQHKWLVMVCLTKVCSDTQTVFDLYLNYDCDEYLNNIFARMMDDVSRVSQGRASSEMGGTPQQEFEMKVKGLECLVLTLRCMKDWAQSIEEPALSESYTEEKDVSSTPLSGMDKSLTASTTSLNELADEGGDDEADFEARKLKKDLREKGIVLFSKKPKKGIKFLQDSGILGSNCEDIATFFHKDERLDKTMIGEYLGEPHQFNLDVMHSYVDQLEFGSRIFLDALRIFLAGFRLPGEAQKIDRLMEKFAGSWFGSNPKNGVFASADAAYVLAYSVIMLTTDLHSSKIKKKMTVEEFVKNNRGINDSKDLPKDYLTGVFNSIEKDEIKMKGPQTVKTHISDIKGKKDQEAFRAGVIRDIGQTATERMKAASNAVFFTATKVEQVRPMFTASWQAMLAALTRPLQESQDPFVISLCLEGLRTAIHIACIFDLEESRTFLQSLAKFTNLSSNLTDIKHKHIEAVKTLLIIGAEEGNYLGDSWNEILRCASQLELAALLGSTIDGRHKNIPDTLKEAASQEIVVSVDKIFVQSRKLNGEAIVSFVRWLCHTSLAELHQKPPRFYSLSKLVEVANNNMERIRLEWSHIWQVMGDHFNKVGCMANTDVANFAVDSLRQLSIKFLEKGELANYSFQKEFLRPFEYIMSHNKSVKIRDMVVCCVAQMVQAKATNIRSGWKNIFFVFSLAASDQDQTIVDLAFKSTKVIFETHFSKENAHRASLITGSFMDAVNCLSEFASNSFFHYTSMEAIKLLLDCAKVVHGSPELFLNPNKELAEEPTIWVRGWFPVLFGLSRIVLKCKLDVRTRALTVMMDIMKSYGDGFTTQWWKDIFDVLHRIFDDNKLRGMATHQERTEWMSTTCNHALRSIVDVVSVYFDTLQDVLLEDVFQLLDWCIHKDNEALARTATECLHIIVSNNGAKFTDKSWELTCKFISNFFESTAPRDLIEFRTKQVMDASGEKPAKLDVKGKEAQQVMFASIIIKCVVQLELIETVDGILLSPAATPSKKTEEQEQPTNPNERREKQRLFVTSKDVDKPSPLFEHVTSERMLVLLTCLTQSNQFAEKFNADETTRNALKKAGFMKNKTKPNLMKQETTSLSCSLRVMFRMYEADNRDDVREQVESRILAVCGSTLAVYLDCKVKETRDIWAPLVCLILQEILRLNDEQFSKHTNAHYEVFTKMICLTFDQSLGNVAFYLSEIFTKTKSITL